MNNQRRIKKWLVEQAAEPQVPPSYPPTNAPSVSVPLSSLHSSDESDSGCSTAIPPEQERRFGQAAYGPTPFVNQRPLPFHARAVPPNQIRVAPSPFYKSPVPQAPLRRMHSYSMDDISKSLNRQRNDLGKRLHFSPVQPTNQYLPAGPTSGTAKMSAGPYVLSPYGGMNPVTSPPRSRSVPQSNFTGAWQSAPAAMQSKAAAPPFEVSYAYQPVSQNNQAKWQGSNVSNTVQYQHPIMPYPGSMQVPPAGPASSFPMVNPAVVNPAAYTHAAPVRVLPVKSDSKSKSKSKSRLQSTPRSHSRSRNHPKTSDFSKQPSKHSPKHNTIVEQPKPTFFKRIMKGLTVPLPTPKVSKPPEHVQGPKSILKQPPVTVISNKPVQRVYASAGGANRRPRTRS